MTHQRTGRPIILFADLDRTLFPNGREEESPGARARLRRLASEHRLALVYATGRHLSLLEDGIREYGVPMPSLAVTDVGTAIYERERDGWRRSAEWEEEIAPDWRGKSREDIASLLADIGELRLQEAAKQNVFKLSYYVSRLESVRALLVSIRERLNEDDIGARLTWSVNEPEGVGLLDVLPARASKLGAIRFLIEKKRFPEDRLLFAGDSGNDLDALTSGLRSVLVRNAGKEVRAEAVRSVRERGLDSLYVAEGNFLGMNGNYTAGVLEGLAHFFPETEAWMEGE